MAVDRLSLVYNARGGVVGELAYAVGRRRGTAHCALCEVTHGRIRQKPAWRDLRRSLTVPLDAYHLNDRPPELAALGGAPLVAAHAKGKATLVLGPGELEPLGGDVQAFSVALRARLAELGFELPGWRVG